MLAMRLVAPNLWGWLVDRIGRKVVVIRASALLAIAGFLLFFFASGFWALFSAMALMSFFWSASLPLVEALTLRHLEGRAEQYGRIRVWGAVGFIGAVVGTGVWLDGASGQPAVVNLGPDRHLLCAALLDPGRAAAPAPTRVPARRQGWALRACFFLSAATRSTFLFDPSGRSRL
jgi:PPP family 3-phenylpropionic acid transporter